MSGGTASRLGAAWSVAVSLGLTIWLIVRPSATLNWLNGFTLVMSALAGLLLLHQPDRRSRQHLAFVMIVAGLLPVMVTGIWLLYLLALGLIAVARFTTTVTATSGDRADVG